GAAEFGVGAIPGTLEAGDLTLDADEETGGLRVADQGAGEAGGPGFVEEGPVDLGLDALEAALVPVGADHGFDVKGFGGGFGVELAAVVVDQGVVCGGVFAGDDDGSGVKPVLEGIEA